MKQIGRVKEEEKKKKKRLNNGRLDFHGNEPGLLELNISQTELYEFEPSRGSRPRGLLKGEEIKFSSDLKFLLLLLHKK